MDIKVAYNIAYDNNVTKNDLAHVLLCICVVVV